MLYYVSKSIHNRLLIAIITKMTNISSVDLSSMRKPYRADEDILFEDSIPRNPFTLFHLWFEAVKNCKDIYEPNAVCLATADSNCCPSARMVLLKGYGTDGFKIFTNTQSRKGRELRENRNAALLFYWGIQHRQVRIEGKVEQLPDEEVVEYFISRPRGSQLSATISNQSEPIESRERLEELYRLAEKQYPNAVEKPDYWGGYKLVADRFEFWQGNSNRLHDRIVFRKLASNELIDNKLVKRADDDWVMERLQP